MDSTSILVGIPEIAEIAQVSRAAVSNWRKRHDDFPEPRVQTDSSVLFDLKEVENWLLERRKIDQPVPPGALVWRFADAVRGPWPAELLVDFVGSWLCYLSAEEQVESKAVLGDWGDQRERTEHIQPKHRLKSLLATPDERLESAVSEAASAVEALEPRLHGLLSHMAPTPFPDPRLLRSFIAELGAAADNPGARVALFDAVQKRGVEIGGRAAGETTTPDGVARLMSRLVSDVLPPDGVVVDPACGTAGLLLMPAFIDPGTLYTEPDGNGHLLLLQEHGHWVGAEMNEAVARRARARCYLYEADADIRTVDALRADPDSWPAADVVLADPPWGLQNWGDADLYRSPRWVFGSPSPRSADTAWLQLCVTMLKDTGRAVVALPSGSLFAGGSERAVRSALLAAGAVEAIIELPARMRPDTSLPMVLWLLRAPTRPVEESSVTGFDALGADAAVLVMDASGLGSTGRSVHTLEEDDISRLVDVVARWRRSAEIPPEDAHIAVSVGLHEILGADADLSPRRYKAPPSAVSIDALARTVEAARVELLTKLEHAEEVTSALVEYMERQK